MPLPPPPPATAARLDHLVINAMLDLDGVERTFRDLGFTVTPRGHHSLGSINHLMVVEGSYLELVGVPATGLQRQDVLDSPLGLSGLVLASADADATHARLGRAGLPALAPLEFSRPIDLGDGTDAAATFRIVRLARDRFPAGRVYFCQHLTPELVWRPEWLTHANGFSAIAGLTIESPDPAADAALFGATAACPPQPSGDGFTVTLADATILSIVAGPAPRLAGADLVFTDMDRLEARAAPLTGPRWRRHDARRATLELPALALTLTCLAPGSLP